jgi:hypothetical protein
MLIITYGQAFTYIRRSYQLLKRVELISDRISYITLRGRSCDIIVLNMHAPTEDKSDDTKDNSYEEVELEFCHFS